MYNVLYLVIGFSVLAVTAYDFFYTTLSGSGAAFITQFSTKLFGKTRTVFVPVLGARRFSALIPMVMILWVLVVWILLSWLAFYLILSAYPEGLIHGTTKVPATPLERFYFVGYTLSTLGIGEFTPVTTLFRVCVSVGSFFGFIFFTVSMTYMLSLSSAAVNKRTLALTIRNSLGTSPRT